jgi:hypothetical protein
VPLQARQSQISGGPSTRNGQGKIFIDLTKLGQLKATCPRMGAEKNPEKRFWCLVPLDSGKLSRIDLRMVRCAITLRVIPCAGAGSPFERRVRYEAQQSHCKI